MTENESQLVLQAYLDGEAAAGQARPIEQLLAKDLQAQALLAELENTKRALVICRECEHEVKVPETREFYWSEIQREIQRLEQTVPAPARTPLWARWKRWLAYSGAVAGLAIAALLAPRSSHNSGELEAAVADTGAFTYRDFKANTTLVWLSFPADKELADNNETSTSD